MTQNSKPHELLESLLKQAQNWAQNKESHFYVFDIDSTLLDVSPRIQRILDDFLKTPEIIANYPEVLKHTEDIKVESTDWGIRHAFERLSVPNIPTAFIDKAKNYWREYFFANTHLPLDLPYAGAVNFVQNLHQLGHHIFYLTGRDVHRMKTGTIASLIQHGFPVEKERVELVLKPDKSIQDTEFKKKWFEDLIKIHPEAQFLFFENEPLNIAAVRHLEPHLKIVFFESTHSRKMEAPKDLPKIQHFKTRK
jgi:hypothetical protein